MYMANICLFCILFKILLLYFWKFLTADLSDFYDIVKINTSLSSLNLGKFWKVLEIFGKNMYIANI